MTGCNSPSNLNDAVPGPVAVCHDNSRSRRCLAEVTPCWESKQLIVTNTGRFNPCKEVWLLPQIAALAGLIWSPRVPVIQEPWRGILKSTRPSQSLVTGITPAFHQLAGGRFLGRTSRGQISLGTQG